MDKRDFGIVAKASYHWSLLFLPLANFITTLRYFVELAYRGTPFVGWQRQPNGLSVQECVEESLSKILRQPISVVGCGRTDSGVHASCYFAHFETLNLLPDDVLYRTNRLLPNEVVVKSFTLVNANDHARFDAVKRTYKYFLSGTRDPFDQDLTYTYYAFYRLDRTKMMQTASLILEGTDFKAFCKSNSDVQHYLCRVDHASWTEKNDQLVFEISANRFLRGMVRLLVGMSIQVGLGNIQLESVADAIKRQVPLKKPLSVPAHGLYLTEVLYENPNLGRFGSST